MIRQATIAIFSLFSGLLMLAMAAAAQTPQAYVGDWIVEGGPLGACKINLSGQAMGGQLKATTFTCAGPMSFAWSWAASGNTVTIMGTGNLRIASLRAERGILAGQLNDGSIVTLKPASGQRIGAPVQADKPVTGRRENCYRRYDNDLCAEASDVTPPRTAGGPVRVQALNQLNIRAQEDMKSPVIGRFNVGQCFLVESCRQTQWGLRCRVPVGDSGQKGSSISVIRAVTTSSSEISAGDGREKQASDCASALFSSGKETPISALPGLAPAMAINGRCNKPIGPGGGTRRLHQKPVGDEVSSDRLLMGAK